MTTIIVAVLVALTPIGAQMQASNPLLFGGGGPDDYGYRYLDSDTTCPGAPTYSWVEIKGIGTEVDGLGDDNVVGPFDIGFDFPYYWYKVTQVYVGSNGYVAFHDNTMAANPFQHVPSPTRPNNLLALLMSDLDLSSHGSVWYWGNADTFIVEFDSCRFWGTGGNNSFQVVLSRPDSSITFQYKEQSGEPTNGWAPNNNQTGIENITGNVGLSYLSGTNPARNMYHSNLAVRFIPPESTSYEVHNCGVRNAMNDRSGGVFAVNGAPMKFWAVAQNYGNQPESDFWSFVRVRDSVGTVEFADSILTSASNPGDADSVVFAGAWTPGINGVYTIETHTSLAGDMFPVDDTITVEMHVIDLPGTLSYDKGWADGVVTWTVPSGYGCRFVPPVYPCSVSSIRFLAQATPAIQCALGLFDDNGSGGSPGDTLYIANVNVGTRNWYSLSPPSPVVIEEGVFFVCGISPIPNAPGFGMDSTPPFSRQCWEYDGFVWAESRHVNVADMMFNATISGVVGVKEELEPVKIGERLCITANPNPFATRCRLSLSSPGSAQAIEVYDATGALVKTLSLENGAAVLDSRFLPGGIYFARPASKDASVLKLVVCPGLRE